MSALSLSTHAGMSCRAARVIAASVLLAIPAARIRAQTKALTLAEVIDLRKNGVSTRQILRNAREYCISFAMNDSARRELSVAGADTTLVGGLGDVCSTQRAARPAVPPLIDDEFVRTSSSQAFAWSDRRCRARFDSIGIRLENASSDAQCMMRYPSAELAANVRIELTIAQLGTSPAGMALLGFGRSGNTSNHYAVSIGADRRVDLCWNADRVCSPLVRPGLVSGVKLGPGEENQLAVEIRDREISVFVNGAAVASYTADGAVSGRLSLGVGPRSSLVVRRLRATALP
jgi:hypothetical protein